MDFERITVYPHWSSFFAGKANNPHVPRRFQPTRASRLSGRITSAPTLIGLFGVRTSSSATDGRLRLAYVRRLSAVVRSRSLQTQRPRRKSSSQRDANPALSLSSPQPRHLTSFSFQLCLWFGPELLLSSIHHELPELEEPGSRI